MRFDTPTTQLANYAVSLSSDALDASSEIATIRHLIDSIGCGWGAVTSGPAIIARDIASCATSAGGASIFCLEAKTSPEYAAFANAVMIRYLDFNDTGVGGHPSDMISAILAVAEITNSSGTNVLKAIYAAYEVVRHLRKAGFHRLRKKHVDQIQSIIGGVVGAGILLKLDFSQMGNAISLAITPNIPLRVTRTESISAWKGCATAHSAMMAVFTARLAQKGLTGPEKPFEGIAGLYDLLDLPPLDFLELGKKLDGITAIESTGFKMFPAEYSAQGPLELLLQSRKEIEIEAIETITFTLHWGGWHEIGGGQGDREEKWNPQTRESADHSLPFLVARALLDGEITIDSFSDKKIHDPRLRTIMDKIDVISSEEITNEHSGELPKWPSIMDIQLKNGKHIQRYCNCPKGHPLNPITDYELEKKFMDLSTQAIKESQARSLLKTLWSLDKISNIKALTDYFRCRIPTDIRP